MQEKSTLIESYFETIKKYGKFYSKIKKWDMLLLLYKLDKEKKREREVFRLKEEEEDI